MVTRHEAPTVSTGNAVTRNEAPTVSTRNLEALVAVDLGCVREFHNFRIDLGINSSRLFTITAKTEAGRAFMTRHFGRVEESVELPKTFAAACMSTMRQEGCL
jgi:hypothetical protein